MLVKKCNKCGVEKELNKFRRKKRNKDGRDNTCKECRNTAYTKKCEFCGSEYKTEKSKQKYCSIQCIGKANRGENNPRYTRVKVNCETCGKEIERHRYRLEENEHQFCSRECKYKGISKIYRGPKRYNYSLRVIECDNCGKQTMKKPTRMERNKHNFCSVECSADFISRYYRGSKRYNYNPHLTDEERKNNESRHNCRKYREWMSEVFEKHDYTCVITGIRGKGNLVAHHLDGWNWCIERRYDVSNGVVLREEIHDLFHKVYGYGDNTEEQFNEFKERYLNNEFEKRLIP